MNTEKSETSLLTERESKTMLLADEELSAVTGGERGIVAQVLGLTVWATATAHGVVRS